MIYSPFDGGVLTFSRILDNQEVLVVANTNVSQPFSGEVIIDSALNGDNDEIDLLFSNNAQAQPPGRASTKAGGSVEIHEVNGCNHERASARRERIVASVGSAVAAKGVISRQMIDITA